MLITGENIDDIDMVSSSAESSKERGKTKEVETETSINTKNKRKGKKIAEASTTKGGKKKKVPSAWDHFKTIEGDKEYVECIYCARKISCASANGTNAMKRHIARCKKAPFNLEKTQTILDFESKTKCNADGTIETVSVPKLCHFDQKKIREALAKMMIVDELPFSFVEREDGLKDVDDSVMKVRAAVKYVRSSPVSGLVFILLVPWDCSEFLYTRGGKTTMSIRERKTSIREFYEVIFSSLLQLSRGITDVDDRKQKEICAAKFKKRDEMSKGKLFEINLEGEEECEICMEMHSKIVLSNCNAGEGGDAGL
ncbi:hypothetical protein V6N13_123799 [Hibiscus sabdariffa]